MSSRLLPMLAASISFGLQLVEAIPSGSQACTSSLPMDTSYTMCGAFCKPEKASNVCSYCKCKRCLSCGGTLTPPSEPRGKSATSTASAPAPASVPTMASSTKKKKSNPAVPTPAPTVTPTPFPVPSHTKKNKATHILFSPPPPPPRVLTGSVKCSSNQHGDTAFESCAAFCKKETSGSHCKCGSLHDISYTQSPTRSLVPPSPPPNKMLHANIFAIVLRFCKCKQCDYCKHVEL